MANRYWIGNSGNWNDTAHWSTTSGGSGGADVPTLSDDVIIDENSFSEVGHTIFFDAGEYGGRSLNCSSASYPFTFDAQGLVESIIFGFLSNVTLRPNMTFNMGGNALLFTGEGINTFTVAGNIFPGCYLFFYSQTSPELTTWNITDDINAQNGSVEFDCNISLGTKNITSRSISFFGTSSTVVNFGSSTLTPEVYFTLGENFILNAGTSQVIANITNGTVLSLNGHTLNYLEINSVDPTSTFVFNDTNGGTINTFKVNDPCDISLRAGNNITFVSFEAIGNVTNKIKIHDYFAYPGTFTFSKSSGAVSCDYLDLTNCHAEGGANWYAGENSIDNGNNDGWIFSTIAILTDGLFSNSYGKLNQGLFFNGISTRIIIPNSIKGGNSVSASFWIYPLSGSSAMIYSESHEKYFAIEYITGGVLRIHSKTSTSSYQTFDSAPGILRAGSWNHIICTYDSVTGYLRAYVNNVLVIERLVGGNQSWVNEASENSIGCYTNAGTYSEFFYGYMDEIGFWAKPLDTEEIDTLYNNGLVTAYPWTSRTVYPSLLSLTFDIPLLPTIPRIGNSPMKVKTENRKFEMTEARDFSMNSKGLSFMEDNTIL